MASKHLIDVSLSSGNHITSEQSELIVQLANECAYRERSGQIVLDDTWENLLHLYLVFDCPASVIPDIVDTIQDNFNLPINITVETL